MAENLSSAGHAVSAPDSALFFIPSILNSPYDEPGQHWDLDKNWQPPQRILPYRRQAGFITISTKPRKICKHHGQTSLQLDRMAEAITNDRQE